MQNNNNKLEGYGPSNTIYSYLVSSDGKIAGSDLNIVGELSQADQHTLRSKGIRFFYLSGVNADRYVYTQGGVHTSEPGGGSVPELDFTVGGIWNPRTFENQEFNLAAVLRGGFLPRRRPPSKDLNLRPYSMKRNQRATMFVVGIDGVKWMATTDFILESVQRVHKLTFEKISSFDGHTIEFTCDNNEVYNFSGKLLDAKGFDQARTWVYNWDRYLDANILARNQSRIMLLYKDKIITGYILGFQSGSAAQSRFVDTLSFSMYVSDFDIGPLMLKGEEQDSFLNGQYYRDRDRGIE
jgi:hypothetical protein